MRTIDIILLILFVLLLVLAIYLQTITSEEFMTMIQKVSSSETTVSNYIASHIFLLFRFHVDIAVHQITKQPIQMNMNIIIPTHDMVLT